MAFTRRGIGLIGVCGLLAVAGCGDDKPPATTTTEYQTTITVTVPELPTVSIPGSIPGSVPGSIPGSIPDSVPGSTPEE
jgi:multidrug efflux pump subunit AcrA (membrane-fusion protein)